MVRPRTPLLGRRDKSSYVSGSFLDPVELGMANRCSRVCSPIVVEHEVRHAAGIRNGSTNADTARPYSGRRAKIRFISQGVWDATASEFNAITPRQVRTAPDSSECIVTLERGRAAVYYQPILHTKVAPSRLRALVRWQHPERGLIMRRLISVARKAG